MFTKSGLFTIFTVILLHNTNKVVTLKRFTKSGKFTKLTFTKWGDYCTNLAFCSDVAKRNLFLQIPQTFLLDCMYFSIYFVYLTITYNNLTHVILNPDSVHKSVVTLKTSNLAISLAYLRESGEMVAPLTVTWCGSQAAP